MPDLIIRRFPARWGAGIIVTSSLATVATIGAAIIAGRELVQNGQIGLAVVFCGFLLGLFAGCALFMIRGYTPMPGLLLVHRLFWATRVSLEGLQSVSFEPGTMRWSFRLFGNGGFFCFSGRYWNRRLGSFRALATDLKDTVVLKLRGKTVVISPDHPEQFVYDVWKAQGSFERTNG